MAEVQETIFASFAPASVIASGQHNLAAWSRACTQIAHGMMSAEIAQFELARTLYAASPTLLPSPKPTANAAAAAQDYLDASRAKFDAAVTGYRRISDELAATFFNAAKSLAQELEVSTPKKS